MFPITQSSLSLEGGIREGVATTSHKTIYPIKMPPQCSGHSQRFVGF